jgi:hypothetical protein
MQLKALVKSICRVHLLLAGIALSVRIAHELWTYILSESRLLADGVEVHHHLRGMSICQGFPCEAPQNLTDGYGTVVALHLFVCPNKLVPLRSGASSVGAFPPAMMLTTLVRAVHVWAAWAENCLLEEGSSER